MKTSFYFVVWILIYPLLGLLHNPTVNQNSFIIALLAVWGLSWLLNRSMPETIRYERVSATVPVLEEVYQGNVDAFIRRLRTKFTLEVITALYFVVAIATMLYVMLTAGANDWVALIIFGFFGFGVMSRTNFLYKCYWSVKQNPTPDHCAELVDRIYGVSYAAYYNSRNGLEGPELLLPPRPRNFGAFKVVSLIISIVCVVLGVLTLAFSIAMMVGAGRSVGAVSSGIMYFLYGSLATIFGIKDILGK